MGEIKVITTPDGRIMYNREGFIRFSHVRKQTAEKYCDEHPKEAYGDEDFKAVYYLQERSGWGNGGGPVGSGLWDETMTNDDRLIDIFTKNEYGE